mgnify:CR=1 FL=1
MWFRLFLTGREIALFDPLDYKYKIVDWMVGEVLDFDSNDVILTYGIRFMIIAFYLQLKIPIGFLYRRGLNSNILFDDKNLNQLN